MFTSWLCLRSTCSRRLHLSFDLLRCYLFWLSSPLPASPSYLPIKNIPECIEGFQHSSAAHETVLSLQNSITVGPAIGDGEQ
ncbi:hypothetical protein ASPBRDRAFT_532475 [Aspergillus brasiliensis CBS 101740]|uniref:Uncharacterized protein n=1 Tax=Aspergillus brasiliensis (strain CBS 101740 / IMI 381727 / IBT 21946) TaxID=767769 RepID=A0A1L9U1P6_ASPBC|nr:hypothetical protein ASPBRDRAFT_532475 [Aspergillus brasiliensis CBS 101740]